MHYDYIEVGTSDHNTLYEHAPATARGLSVEPLEYYLNRIGGVASDTKIKVNAAMVPVKTEPTAPIYFVDEALHPEYVTGAYHWVRGSNSVFKPHPIVSEKVPLYAVSIKHVPIHDWKELLSMHDVTSIERMKIDVEGLDVALVDAYCEYMSSAATPFYPKQLVFECWTWTLNDEATTKLFQRLVDVGYKVHVIIENNHVSDVHCEYIK